MSENLFPILYFSIPTKDKAFSCLFPLKSSREKCVARNEERNMTM